MKTSIDFDNRRPDGYPHFPQAEFSEKNLVVKRDDYIVDGDGDIMIVTSPNKRRYPNAFLKSINQGFIRARYIGNRDDSLEYANQIRFATEDEIKKALKFRQKGFKVNSVGQTSLL